MSVVIYQKGTTHNIDGFKVNLKKVLTKFFTGTPEEGWSLTPKEAYEEAETQTKEEDTTKEVEGNIKEVATEHKVLKPRVTANTKIREAAKKAGIENYATARIDTLKAKLSG